MRLQRATPRGGGTEFSAACMRRYRSSATRVIWPLREPGCTAYMCRRGAEAPNGGAAPGWCASFRETIRERHCGAPPTDPLAQLELIAPLLSSTATDAATTKRLLAACLPIMAAAADVMPLVTSPASVREADARYRRTVACFIVLRDLYASAHYILLILQVVSPTVARAARAPDTVPYQPRRPASITRILSPGPRPPAWGRPRSGPPE